MLDKFSHPFIWSELKGLVTLEVPEAGAHLEWEEIFVMECSGMT